ncbi:MAG: amino acid adenylation domain-containing protein [Acidobacteriia bacterium]|nr:amino acid adenylation domain-containing protein [Terriglobia bacterium]
MPYILQQLLTESAKGRAEHPAVWARGRTLSYRELDQRSNQLAHLLRQRGLKKGDRIGIFFPKAVESLVAMFGALKAGVVYVPLDPNQPADRISYIIGNCGIRALVTIADRYKLLDPAAIPSVEFVVFAHELSEAFQANMIPWSALDGFPATHAPELQATTTDLAYILYTSGSTGRPKGVMLSHQNALTFVEWCAETFDIRQDDHVSNHAPLHFDLSVFDVYNSIKAGATVYMVPDEIAVFPASLTNWIVQQQITVWYSVPSALVYLVLHGRISAERLPQLRLILFAGEVFPQKYLKQLAEILPHVELYNLYGPTETNVCTYYRVDRAILPGMDKLPIGRACANTEVLAVDEQDRVVGVGEVGELYVRGPAVTPGYWGDPEKTAKMCVPNRFQANFEEKMYRTGDLVQPDENGDYYFLGRRDNQIKSRGYRIELGEIEAALLSHTGVCEAAVIAVPDDEVGNRIKAFVAPHQPGSMTAVDMQQHCATKVPKYMIPEVIELWEALPKTSTGKIDRVRLKQPRSLAAD